MNNHSHSIHLSNLVMYIKVKMEMYSRFLHQQLMILRHINSIELLGNETLSILCPMIPTII